MKKLLLILSLLFCSTAFAATYYVDGSAANDTGDGSVGSPKKYIRSGVALLSGGDTLIIADGTYTGLNNMLSVDNGWEWHNGIPNGTSGAYTTIQAETDFGVTIDGGGEYNPFYIDEVSYVKIQGINFTNTLAGFDTFCFINSHHIKVIRCSGYEGAGNGGNLVFRYCQYGLMEECFAYGRNRYMFDSYEKLSGQTHSYNIFRRCVARFDYDVTPNGQTRPKACFTSYWSPGTIYQNCIAIDSKNASTDGDDLLWGAFYAPNGGTSDLQYLACIGLNIDAKGFNFEDGNDDSIINNCVIFDIPDISIAGDRHNGFNSNNGTDNLTLTNNTFGNIVLGDAYPGIRVSGTGGVTNNNIFVSFTGSMGVLSVPGTHDYNSFYGNTDNFDSGSASAHELCSENSNSINPLTNGLLYLPRIEAASTLKTAGSSGGQIGAEIVYKLGVSGTLYGETGWNTLTGDLLWPFPNEDTIRTQMRAYNLHSVDGTRGFCADGETLTHYIMNYLGNGNPYSEGGTATTKSSTSGNVLLSGGVSLN